MIERYYQAQGRSFRQRRFACLQALLARLPTPLRILDVGGRPEFYADHGFLPGPGVSVVLLNVSAYTNLPPGFESVVGDGRDLSRYGNGSFDVVHSNSVLAYVGGPAGRQRMAAEIQRVGRRFFVQTPNRNFPLDWRTATPFFHYLPVDLRASIVSRFPVGRQRRLPSRPHAEAWAREVEDVGLTEFRRLFPAATIIREKSLGLTKSFIAHQGFPSMVARRGSDVA